MNSLLCTIVGHDWEHTLVGCNYSHSEGNIASTNSTDFYDIAVPVYHPTFCKRCAEPYPEYAPNLQRFKDGMLYNDNDTRR